MSRNSYSKIVSVVLGLCMLVFAFSPLVAHAQTPNPNAGTGITYDCAAENPGRAPGECNYYDLVKAVNKVIKTAIIYALSFSVVIIAYAGFIYLTSGGNVSKRQKANEMFKKVAIGIAIMLSAYLIVTLIANALISTNITDDKSYPLKP